MFNKPFKITTNYLFRYVLPPPSRPKYPDNNYLTAPLYNNYNRQTFQVVPIPPTAINSLYYNYKNNIVPSLGIQYIPNIGNRYTYVLPAAASTSTATTSTTTTTSATAGLYVKPDKLNGKYNPKLKKHKAYEKYNSNNKRSSYVSLKYSFQSKLYEFLFFSVVLLQYFGSAFQQQQRQPLPYLQAPQPFRAIPSAAATAPASTTTISTTKLRSIVKTTNGNNKYNHNNPNAIVNLSKKS